jgi:hypothetical protein
MDHIEIKGTKIKNFKFIDSDSDELQKLIIDGTDLQIDGLNKCQHSERMLFILLLKTIFLGWKTRRCITRSEEVSSWWFTAVIVSPYGNTIMEIPMQYWDFLDVPEYQDMNLAELEITDFDSILKSWMYDHQ